MAKFRNVLIGGPYTIEEVDTAVRYVIPDPQSVSIQWNRVAERSFANILKKFTVTVNQDGRRNRNTAGRRHAVRR